MNILISLKYQVKKKKKKKYTSLNFTVELNHLLIQTLLHTYEHMNKNSFKVNLNYMKTWKSEIVQYS